MANETEDKEHDQSKNDEDEICAAMEHNLKADEDLAMNIVLFFLPGILYRLPQNVKTLLDLGAGPTVYIPIAFRDRAEEMFTSDYAPANREALKAWIEDRSDFDWADVCQWIATIEASRETGQAMQTKARNKMRAVLQVNVHNDPVVEDISFATSPSVNVPKQFEVVTTIFCLEYSCESFEEYKRAVKGATSLIQVGGYLVQGGVMGETNYSFGGKKFRCHCLHQSHIIESLKENGMQTDEKEGGFKFIMHEEIFLLVSKKLR